MANAAFDSNYTNNPFFKKVKLWSDNASENEFADWEDQIRMLSEIGDLITPDLSLEEVIAAIYSSVNQLMDAYQFSVGIYNEDEEIILFKGVIENNMPLPDLNVNVFESNRLAPWCILNASDIFINDMEKEYKNYVKEIPFPKIGSQPKAALYVPLRMNNKVSGLITVRTINKNVYQKHHLYILKTLGNFVMRSRALAKETSKPFVQIANGNKHWRWCDLNQLAGISKKQLLKLSEREKEVLFHMVSGLPNRTIAEKLFISPGTIKTHTLNIYQKMEVGNRTSAIMKAIELNWFV